jgi:hypothetical protein
MRRWTRWWMLYQTVGFVILIPVMSHYVLAEGLPQKILLFVIPAYVLLAWSFFAAFRNLSKRRYPAPEFRAIA